MLLYQFANGKETFNDSPASAGPNAARASCLQMSSPRNQPWNYYRATARVLTLALTLSALALLLAWYKKGALPAPAEVLPEVLDAPLQTPVKEPEGELTYRGATYVFQPVASYVIQGVVVTHNNIAGIGNVYQNSSNVDIKDLCLVWGENITEDRFRQVEFWSEPWSCHYRFSHGPGLRNDQLSNNHLLSEREEVREVIRSIHIGDQVRLVGRLINYYMAGYPEYVRKSSLVRTDEGNGACEVLLVDSAEVLKAATPGWYRAYGVVFQLTFWLFALKLITFLLFPFLEYRAGF